MLSVRLELLFKIKQNKSVTGNRTNLLLLGVLKSVI